MTADFYKPKGEPLVLGRAGNVWCYEGVKGDRVFLCGPVIELEGPQAGRMHLLSRSLPIKTFDAEWERVAL